MKRSLWISISLIMVLVVGFGSLQPAAAMPPYPDDKVPTTAPELEASIQSVGTQATTNLEQKLYNQRNPAEVARIRERMKLVSGGNTTEADLLAKTGTDRVLVILIEFAGTDTFTWDPATSHWDPLGISDPAEDTGTAGDCSEIALKMGVTSPVQITYGPTLHNQLPRPLSAADRSGDTIWTPDFSPQWFNDFMFGDGIVFDYTRQDESVVYEDFTGESVNKFYEDMSGGLYHINGDVVGWIQLPHSATWYGSDECPGARSLSLTGSVSRYGFTPGAGNAKTMVMDAVNAVDAIKGTIPGFDWANYDLNDDGYIDRLWIVHAGYGEEDSTVLLNRVAVQLPFNPSVTQTGYGESAMWSHSSSVVSNNNIGTTGYKVGAYITMPENGGIGVFAHEYGHNLGANDLYAYNGGETSAGFWTTMADDWTGYPIGYEPPALDPMHEDWFGWLNPRTVIDPTQVYTVTLGQASNFPASPGVYRGAKIILPEGRAPLGILPFAGNNMFWGGQASLLNSMMTLKTPIAVPAGGGSLEIQLVYDIETEWDFLWVQASKDGGATWDFLKSPNMICTHDPGWIGGLNGLPDDLCGNGIYGFSGYTLSYPDYEPETFDLSAYAGQSILLRFWYMTDWATEYAGPFIDDITVTSGATTLFSDGAEAGPGNWNFADEFQINDGFKSFEQAYYLQWRNVAANGGYDSSLGDPRYRYGPTNTGLLVWYNNGMYADNEIFGARLVDFPSFGPKGQMLVVDANSDPYRDPDVVAAGFANEGANLPHRSLMRDAPFSLNDSVDFLYGGKKYDGRLLVDYFDDALGYYPGSENVKRGPLQGVGWVTKQWDASTVVPGLTDYPVKAPGYVSGSFRFDCGVSLPYLLCYSFSNIGSVGGNGNPSQTDAQYGWRVQLVDQAVDGTTATVKIWNTRYNGTFAPDKNHIYFLTGKVTYTYPVPADTTDSFCVDLQTDRMEYVSSANLIPLSQSCAEVVGAPLPTLTASDVVALAWVPSHGLGTDISFTVKPILKETTRFNLSLNRYKMGNLVYSLPANTVVAEYLPFFSWIPTLFK